jgi:hypothetical protein
MYATKKKKKMVEYDVCLSTVHSILLLAFVSFKIGSCSAMRSIGIVDVVDRQPIDKLQNVCQLSSNLFNVHSLEIDLDIEIELCSFDAYDRIILLYIPSFDYQRTKAIKWESLSVFPCRSFVHSFVLTILLITACHWTLKLFHEIFELDQRAFQSVGILSYSISCRTQAFVSCLNAISIDVFQRIMSNWHA